MLQIIVKQFYMYCILDHSLQGKKIEATPLSMYNYFIERVKENLHVVLAMSPIGDAFRNRLRMFPSLINCCTIDWFQVSGDLVVILQSVGGVYFTLFLIGVAPRCS